MWQKCSVANVYIVTVTRVKCGKKKFKGMGSSSVTKINCGEIDCDEKCLWRKGWRDESGVWPSVRKSTQHRESEQNTWCTELFARVTIIVVPLTMVQVERWISSRVSKPTIEECQKYKTPFFGSKTTFCSHYLELIRVKEKNPVYH
jgi:hypothetical protein